MFGGAGVWYACDYLFHELAETHPSSSVYHYNCPFSVVVCRLTTRQSRVIHIISNLNRKSICRGKSSLQKIKNTI